MATYDGAGNPTGYKGHDLDFDAENRLTNYDNGDLQNGYTGDGLRAWKQVNGQRTQYVYEGTDVIGELDVNGVPQFNNTFGPAGLISRYNNTSSDYLRHYEPGFRRASAAVAKGCRQG